MTVLSKLYLSRTIVSRLRLILIETPLCLERLLYPLGLSELEGAGLLGHGGALLLGSEAGHQLGHQSAGLLGVEVASLLGDVHQGVHLLVVTLLWPLLGHAALATDLHRLLLAIGVIQILSKHWTW